MYKQLTINVLGSDNTCIKVYDPEKQELIGVYKTYKDAANRLGLTQSLVQHACANKNRSWCEKLNMYLAIRLSAIKEGDRERMEHCRKHLLLKEYTPQL